MPTRSTALSATLNGSALSSILSASCTYSWKALAQATVYVRTSPGAQLYNQQLVLTMGAGSHNVVRFNGLLRGYSFALFPKAIGLTFLGFLTQVQEYQNHEDPLRAGGLTLTSLTGGPTATDADVVKAVLDKTGVSYSAGNIGGTGVTWGSRSSALGSINYLWRAGTSSNPMTPLAAAGQGALDYIHEWDRVSAVYTNATSAVGFYRLYETVNGIFRALIGGRPRATPHFTFSEGVDILLNATTGREYPMANAAFVSGFDPGITIGAVRNQQLDPATGSNSGTFLGQSSNPFQAAGKSVTYDFSSPYIEWGTEAEAGIGMNCERVGNALLADLNRETVTARFRTPRDDLIVPGMTILVQGPGGSPDRLGIGEPVWVDQVTTGVAEDGEFYQDIMGTGGGTPNDYTAEPPS